jgi:glycosyltransferase involved in cell wall biosynthesis
MIVINARFLTQSMTGVQRYCFEISIRLKYHYGNQIKFVSPKGIILKEEAEVLGAKIIGNYTSYYWEQIELPVYLRAIGSPLLLCMANMAPILYKNKISVIHDIAFMVYPQTFSKSFLYAYKVLIPWVIRTSKLVLTVSEFSKNEILRYYSVDSEKVKVLYPGLKKEFRIQEHARECIGGNYILAVSSLNYRKNFVRILQAFELVSKECKDVKLFIVGDIKGNHFATVDIEHYINNPSFCFLGRVSDGELNTYYNNALCFLFPSLYEGFGFPLLEAQACGCPVITSNVASMPEVAGGSALLCNPASVEDIKNKILQMINDVDTRRNYAELGQNNVLRFNYDNTVNNVIEIVNNYNK